LGSRSGDLRESGIVSNARLNIYHHGGWEMKRSTAFNVEPLTGGTPMFSVAATVEPAELSMAHAATVAGGNRGMIAAGAGMISGSIGMAALGAAALGPIGIMFAAGLAFGGGVAFGSGTRMMLSRR
jgi:hypothetical protein